MLGGPGRFGGCPLCGPQLVVSPCVSEREERFVTVAGQMKPGSLFFFFFFTQNTAAPLLPYLFLAVRGPTPSSFCHTARNLFPGAEATLMWEARQRQSETQTPLCHSHTHTNMQTHTPTQTHTHLHLRADTHAVQSLI